MSLQHGQNSQCEILVGKRGKFSNQKLRVSAAEISLSTCENDADSDQFQIRVEVINTTVDMEVIHKVSRMRMISIFFEVRWISGIIQYVLTSVVGRAITFTSSCGFQH